MEDQEIQKLEDDINAALEQENVSPEAEEREPDDIELQAMAQGWKPSGVKSAAEFLRAAPLYTELEKRGRRIDSLEKKLDAILEYNKKQEDLRRAQELDYLNNERINAIQQGSVERVQKVEKQIADYVVTPEPVATDLQGSPEALAFIDKYREEILSSEETRTIIDTQFDNLLKYNLPPKEHFAKLEEILLNSKEKKSPAMAVETSQPVGQPTRQKKSYTRNDLNKDQREVLKMIVGNNIMSEKDYINSLVAQGDLK